MLNHNKFNRISAVIDLTIKQVFYSKDEELNQIKGKNEFSIFGIGKF